MNLHVHSGYPTTLDKFIFLESECIINIFIQFLIIIIIFIIIILIIITKKRPTRTHMLLQSNGGQGPIEWRESIFKTKNKIIQTEIVR